MRPRNLMAVFDREFRRREAVARVLKAKPNERHDGVIRRRLARQDGLRQRHGERLLPHPDIAAPALDVVRHHRPGIVVPPLRRPPVEPEEEAPILFVFPARRIAAGLAEHGPGVQVKVAARLEPELLPGVFGAETEWDRMRPRLAVHGAGQRLLGQLGHPGGNRLAVADARAVLLERLRIVRPGDVHAGLGEPDRPFLPPAPSGRS